MMFASSNGLFFVVEKVAFLDWPLEENENNLKYILYHADSVFVRAYTYVVKQ